MDRASAGAFVFAKASGNLGKSFIGPRANVLFEQKTLADMWTLLFKSPVPMVPEVMLAEQIEKEAFNKFFSDYVNYINQFDSPKPVLKELLCSYEAENVKLLGAALCNGEENLPRITELGPFQTCNYNAWPDIAEITRESDFAWFDHVPSVHEQQQMEYKLDTQVLRNLWNAIGKEKGEEREALKNLFETEFVIKNIVWALRLRIYFKMEKDEILKHLMYVSENQSADDPVAGPAIKTLDYPLDEADVWSRFKYSDLLNPHVSGEVWQIDPAWLEMKGKAKLNKLALSVFHQYPMTGCSLVGWFKIKEYELTCIRTAVESIRLNINPEEAKKAVGILTD